MTVNTMTKKTTLRLALIQHMCSVDREDNWAVIRAGIEQAAVEQAELVLLQELHNGPYFCLEENTESFDLAETIPGPSTEFLAELASQHKLVIVGSLFEKRAAGLYHNTAVVIDADAGLVGRYRKMHIPDDPGFYEKFYFTPGDTGFAPVQTRVGKLGVLVCWDQWFPEAARLMAMAGADILLYPTAIGWDPADEADEKQRQRDAWITIQRSHAIANGLPLASCNRIGTEVLDGDLKTRIDFWGSSFVCGPQGEIIEQATTDEAAVLIADIDMSRSEQTRRIWPYLRDRRIDAYEGLLKRYLDD